MGLDPILPLSISIATSKGTYALFLGSGVSLDAGIPTGSQLLHETKKTLYLMDKEIKNVENKNDFKKWIKENEIDDIEYSDLLEMFPSEEDRRSFLEPFFSGKQPTESHKIIAKMVEDGFVKVIITTNFDRLLEKALEDRGLDFDVVSSPHDLKVLKPREHSNCRIVKVHGDYKHLNIKNTKKNLKN